MKFINNATKQIKIIKISLWKTLSLQLVWSQSENYNKRHYDVYSCVVNSF